MQGRDSNEIIELPYKRRIRRNQKRSGREVRESKRKAS